MMTFPAALSMDKSEYLEGVCCREYAAGSMLQGVCCREYAAGSMLQGVCCREYAAGSMLQGVCRESAGSMQHWRYDLACTIAAPKDTQNRGSASRNFT